MSDSPPTVSVIIPAYRAWDVLPGCLEALRQQVGDVSFETIVVASGVDSGESPLAARFPDVRFLLCRERKFPGVARNLGAAAARGELLLFLDADCELAPGGLGRVVDIHARYAAPLIGGCIDPGDTATGVGWGYYFASFARWLAPPGDEPVPVLDLATPCCSIKRWAFEQYGPFAEDRYCEDTRLCWQVRAAGHEVLLDPGHRVRHSGLEALGPMLRRKFSHGGAFAVMRAETRGWSLTRRRIRALAAPVVPVVLIYRIARAVFHAGRYRRRFLQSLPFTWMAVVAWTLGETVALWRTTALRPRTLP